MTNIRYAWPPDACGDVDAADQAGRAGAGQEGVEDEGGGQEEAGEAGGGGEGREAGGGQKVGGGLAGTKG